MNIAGLEIGLSFPPVIVCEIGAAHNGSLETAVQLLRHAKEARADMVKVQCFLPETITADYDRPEFTIQDGPWKGHKLIELYRRAHMPREWFPVLFAEAMKLDIPLFASVFSAEDVAFMAQFDPPAYKIASFELIDPILVKVAAAENKPMIMSTGMASWGDINGAARNVKNYNTVWMHCVSAYPTAFEDVGLSMMSVLRRQFDHIGLSDHTQTAYAAMMAVALNACMIEKHITMTPGGDGLDDNFALGPDGFADFVNAVHKAYQAMGKLPVPAMAVREVDRMHAPLRRSLYAAQDIRAGQVFTSDTIRSIRPGLGLHPKFYSHLIGATAAMDIPAGTPLAAHMVKDWPTPEL